MNYKEKYEATLQELEKNKEMYQNYITQIEDDHEKANEEKEKEITSLRQTIKGYQNVDAHKNRINEGGRLYNCDENIRIKQKTKKSNQNVTINITEYFNCEYSECNMSNVDLIKCYSCDKWVCENCHHISVTKIKSIMSKCNTLYFNCKECVAIEESSKEVNNNKSRSNDKLDGINSHMINQLENHLEKWEKKIEEKLDEKLGEIDNKLKCMKVPTQKECKTFADAVTSNLQKVSEVEKKMTSLSKMPEELNKTIVDIMNNDQSKSIKGIIKVAICENRSDEKKSEGRKKNIILFNVPESPSESPEERKEEDITFFNKMCESIC